MYFNLLQAYSQTGLETQKNHAEKPATNEPKP